jgi:hypothetical protein
VGFTSLGNSPFLPGLLHLPLMSFMKAKPKLSCSLLYRVLPAKRLA